MNRLLEELRKGEELLHRITNRAMLGERIEFNDLELANRWRMRVKAILDSQPATPSMSGDGPALPQESKP